MAIRNIEIFSWPTYIYFSNLFLSKRIIQLTARKGNPEKISLSLTTQKQKGKLFPSGQEQCSSGIPWAIRDIT